MTKHTPGPWAYNQGLGNGNRLHPFVKAEAGPVICSCRTDNKHANARLIAAAPQLLEELKLAIQGLEYLNRGPDKGTERAKALMEALT